MTNRKIENGVLPLEAGAGFAASVEEALIDATRKDSRYPMLCMDGEPTQLPMWTRTSFVPR